MDQIRITRDLLERLFDFADHIHLYTPDWVRDKYNTDSEWLFLSEKINKLLESREEGDVNLQS